MRVRFVLGSLLLCLVLSGAVASGASAQTGAARPEAPRPAVNRRPFDHIGNAAEAEAKKGRVSKIDALTVKQKAASESNGRSAPGANGSGDVGAAKKGERGAGGGYLKLPDIEGESEKVRPAPRARSEVRSESKKDVPMDELMGKVDQVPARPSSPQSGRPGPGEPRKGAGTEKRSMFELQKSNDELKQLADPEGRGPHRHAAEPPPGTGGPASKGSGGKGVVKDNELHELGGTLRRREGTRSQSPGGR
jgi:hypothetical protein